MFDSETRAIDIENRHGETTIATPTVRPRAVLTPRETRDFSNILLPQEYVAFATRPHPVVYTRAVLPFAIGLVAVAIALTRHAHPIVHGHHRSVALITTMPGIALVAFGAIVLYRAFASLARAATYRYGRRIVATNRRIFVVDGLLGRRIRPLANSTMASARLTQGILGRRFGFGSIVMDAESLRDLRDPIDLYRSVAAVGNGATENDWTPAARMTIV